MSEQLDSVPVESIPVAGMPRADGFQSGDDFLLNEEVARAKGSGPCMFVVFSIEPDAPGSAQIHMFRQTRGGFPTIDFDNCLRMLRENLQAEVLKLAQPPKG